MAHGPGPAGSPSITIGKEFRTRHRNPPGTTSGREAGLSTILTDEQRETVLANVPLVEHIVNRVAAGLPASHSRDDLVQTGILGLISATVRFDPDAGSRVLDLRRAPHRGGHHRPPPQATTGLPGRSGHAERRLNQAEEQRCPRPRNRGRPLTNRRRARQGPRLLAGRAPGAPQRHRQGPPRLARPPGPQRG